MFKIDTKIRFNNIDVAYNVSFKGKLIDIAVATEKDDLSFVVYEIINEGKKLKRISNFIDNQIVSYGLCLYHHPETKKLYAFITGQKGGIEQWEIFDGGSKMTGKKVRQMKLDSITEGCVVDHEYGIFYTAEENVGLWKFKAAPDESTKGELIYKISDHPTFLKPDLEGVTLYYRKNGEGQLIVSVQSRDQYAVFDRQDNRYLGSFKIKKSSNGSIDQVSHTDGIDVISTYLGPKYPYGLFIAQDDENRSKYGTRLNQNFKGVSIQDINTAMGSSFFPIDNRINPREFIKR